MKFEDKKTLGIIGGMGPAATADLFQKIIALTPAKKDQDHLHVIIDSDAEIPDRSKFIISRDKGVETASPAPALIASAKRLQKAGVDFIVMACNTAHLFEDEIQQSISVPFFGIPQITAQALKAKSVKKVVILSTAGTASAHIFDKPLKEQGIKFTYSACTHAKLLHELIYSLVKSSEPANMDVLKHQTMQMLHHFNDQDFTHFMLACTELPIAFKTLGLLTSNFTDCTKELARFCVQYALEDGQ